MSGFLKRRAPGRKKKPPPATFFLKTARQPNRRGAPPGLQPSALNSAAPPALPLVFFFKTPRGGVKKSPPALTVLFTEDRSAHAEGVPHVAVKIGHRVLGLSVLADLKVEMGPCCHAGLPHGTDHLPGPDGVALLHRKVPALAI